MVRQALKAQLAHKVRKALKAHKASMVNKVRQVRKALTVNREKPAREDLLDTLGLQGKKALVDKRVNRAPLVPRA